MDTLDELDSLSCEDMAPEQEAEILEEKIINEDIQPVIHLDYKLKTCAERAELVHKIVEQTPRDKLTNRYLEILSDYIIGGISKEEKKARLYLTDNRLITINKRETSFEGLAEKFENGEDGIYNLITEDKNMLFAPKQEITAEDIETIPGLKQLRADIADIERACKAATGKRKYLLKKQLIEMRKDQYILKSMFKPTIQLSGGAHGVNKIHLEERRWIDENGEPQSSGLISFFNPKHISALLCNYKMLKLEMRARFQSDFYYLLQDFDNLLFKALKNEPMYLDVVKLKIKGKMNVEIQAALGEKYGTPYTVEYISALWRNKIPKYIAEYAKKDYLIWHFTNVSHGPWKYCSRCGQRKPAHNYFFSKNSTSKDGFYSICKECRNKKK